jgi:hypothetical protein
MRGRMLSPIPFLLLAVPILLTGCASEKKVTQPPVQQNAYVGSAACGSLSACHHHDSVVGQAQGWGHHFMLTPVVNGQKPGAPLILPDNPPNGSWSQVAFVLGGFGRKALFVTSGHQFVTGAAAQYDLPSNRFPDPAFAPFAAGQSVAYGFSCFQCHTTGPDSTTGTFNEPGVQCEACHGMGKLHTLHPSASNIILDDSAALCGRCHSRSANGARVGAAGGFIENYQQYQEFQSSSHHAELTCESCHAHHVGVQRNQSGGLARVCTDCHLGQTIDHVQIDGRPNCVDCHMARATLSARAANRYTGDVSTHIFRIHDGAQAQDAMFESVGGSTFVKQGYGVTLDFACYSCHKDANGVGGTRSQKSLDDLYAKAREIHGDDAATKAR